MTMRSRRRSFIRYELGKKKGGVTTAAVGEEAGQRPKPGEVTTMAVGEETGAPPGRPTTLVVGEEAGSPPRTTTASGEEAGGL